MRAVVGSLLVLALHAHALAFTLPTAALGAPPSLSASDHNLYTSETPGSSTAAAGFTVGTLFTNDYSGTIVGGRWWKWTSESPTSHVIKLWTSGGSLLYSETIGGESSSGWQTFTFGTPQTITASTQYVLSVDLVDGVVYSVVAGVGIDNAPLHMAHDGGVQAASHIFPTNATDGLWTFVDPKVHSAP